MSVQTFKTRDEVPADQIEQAIEAKDGTFYLYSEENTSGLKSALQKERDARERAEKALKAKEEAESTHELRTKGLLEAKKEWDAKQLAPLAERAAKLESENVLLKLVGPVKEVFRSVGIIDPDDAWTRYGGDVQLSETGTPMLKSDPTADVGKWAEGLKAKHPHWFAGTQADGGGAGGSRNGVPISKTISAGDTKAFLAHVDEIAAGKVAVI